MPATLILSRGFSVRIKRKDNKTRMNGSGWTANMKVKGNKYSQIENFDKFSKKIYILIFATTHFKIIRFFHFRLQIYS